MDEKKYHTRKGMSPQILDILKDGEWHTVQECFCILSSVHHKLLSILFCHYGLNHLLNI